MDNNLIQDSNNIGNIEIDKDKKVIKGDFYVLPYYKNSFFEQQEYVKFIKAIEKLVRRSDEYKSYKDYVMNEVGLNYCMLQPNITGEVADIEMHHGPILTLFDYCDIVVNYHLKKQDKINTFLIANEILELHFANEVQVVMLSQTSHELLHSGKVFLSPKQAWGDLTKFIKKYEDGIEEDQRKILNKYIELMDSSTTDNDFLKVTKNFKSYSNKKFNKDDILSELEDEVEDFDF